MITSRSDDLLVGFVSLLLLPLIAWRIFRGLRDGSLPLYRTYVDRTGGSRFRVLLALHVLSFLLVALVAADLLLDLRLRDSL